MSKFFFVGSILLFGLSLFLPVYAEKPDLVGYFALFGGWMIGANDIPTAVSWIANVLFIFAMISALKRKNPKPRLTFILAVLALIFALSFLGAGKAIVGASETVGKLSIGTAFYAWIGSFVLMIVSAWFRLKQKPDSLNQSEEPLKS